MTAPVRERLRSSKMLQGSAWILIALALQSLLGFVFWLLGSRVATPDELGQASALYTGIQFVNYASGLGLTVALARHAVDRSRQADSLFGWAVLATVVSSSIGGIAYLAVTSSSSSTEVVTGSPAGWFLFCAYTAGSSIGILADVRLMAAHRWAFMVGRIVVTGLVRIALLALEPPIDPAVWLYTLMLAPLAIGGVISAIVLPLVDAGRIRFGRPEHLGAIARYSGVNWGATLASQAPQFVLPLVVAQSIASAPYANFFLAWTVTGLVFLVPGAIAQVLLVEGSKDADDAARAVDHEPSLTRAREALGFSLVVSVLALVGSIVAGGIMTVLFGDAYADAGRILPLLIAAGIPWSFTAVRLAEARIRRDQFATVAITVTLGLGILVPTLLLVPTHGSGGAVVAWLGGNIAAALVAVTVHQRRRGVARLGAASG